MLNLLATARNKDKKPYGNKLERIVAGLVIQSHILETIYSKLLELLETPQSLNTTT